MMKRDTLLICPDLMKMGDRKTRENKYWKQTSESELNNKEIIGMLKIVQTRTTDKRR
ncbi:MAG: hypothetical protein Ct9H90mP18_02700 [Gammaproteobacteria bacterium]|nr:MAG: hypothetical protein Ct9H90mP18_02700 [Gammaproteobacteria bacterium]